MDRPVLKSVAMTDTNHYAGPFSREKGHQFSGSPKFSNYGYYLDCTRCRLSVFEDGTGSAADRTCERGR